MANKNLMPLREHYERKLGAIARGWFDEKQVHGIQIVSFKAQPEPGVTTFATLGLSRYVLDLSDTQQIRQELLISANDVFSADAVAGLVLSLAEHVAQRGKALLRGEVIGPGEPVISGSTLTAVYVTNPSPFDKSLTEFASESPATVFAYLVPITAAESSLVREHGWSWFEAQLEAQNPDIWDMARSEEVSRPG
jgi:antitoxin YqcF